MDETDEHGERKKAEGNTFTDDPTSGIPRSHSKSEQEAEIYTTSGGVKNNTHGIIYQLKLLMLFLYRGTQRNYNFKLATERSGVGAFDDVFFEYDDKRICLQAKHKQNSKKKILYNDIFPSTKDKSDGEFAIQKYFISYLQAKQDSIREGKDLEQVVICTNVGFNFEDRLRLKQTDEENYLWFSEVNIHAPEYETLKTLLYIDGGSAPPKFYKVLDTEINTGIKSILDTSGLPKGKQVVLKDLSVDTDVEAEKRNFLAKLIFAVNQPDELELGEQIKKELGIEYQVTDSDLAYDHFQGTMLGWFKEKEGTYLVASNGAQFFAEGQRKLAISVTQETDETDVTWVDAREMVKRWASGECRALADEARPVLSKAIDSAEKELKRFEKKSRRFFKKF